MTITTSCEASAVQTDYPIGSSNTFLSDAATSGDLIMATCDDDYDDYDDDDDDDYDDDDEDEYWDDDLDDDDDEWDDELDESDDD